MSDVTTICDRCGKTIEGMHVPADETGRGFTAGYYDCSGSPWAEFVEEDEMIVCDACMWAEPRYIAVYGDQRVT